MEITDPTTAVTYARNCFGCRRHRKDVMLSVHSKTGERNEFTDIFLTTAQAESLLASLQGTLERNAEGRTGAEDEETREDSES